jgi:Flp pilus assembly protein TadD
VDNLTNRFSLLFSCASIQKKQSILRDAELYNRRGIAYEEKGQHDQAISDYNKALEINPRLADAYNNRGVAYYFKGEYEKSWEDVKKAQNLGCKILPEFLDNLRKASGRQN